MIILIIMMNNINITFVNSTKKLVSEKLQPNFYFLKIFIFVKYFLYTRGSLYTIYKIYKKNIKIRIIKLLFIKLIL